MKKYLNSKDLTDLLFVFHMVEINTSIVNRWVEYGNMTRDEAKWIKTAITYNMKAMKSILDRLPQKEKDKFVKRTIKAQNEPIRIVDKWMHDRVFGTYETEFEIVKIERPEFEKLGMLCSKKYCEDCGNNFSDCSLYDIFENNMMSRVEKLHNCPYAFHSEKKLEELKAMKAEIEEKRNNKKISKRKQKKIKNRFDEE